jgi:hypothetical protein
MQDNNRFFQFVWRVNALAIAAVAVVAGMLGLYGLGSIVGYETRDREVTDLVTVDPEVPRQEEARLGQPFPIGGTQVVRIPLYLAQKTDATYYIKSSGDNIVNELYVDSNTGKSTWLFKGTKRLIFNQTSVLRQLKSEQPNVTSLVYALVDNDSNKDGRLSPKDLAAIGYSSPDGAIYTPLIDGIEKLYAIEQVSDDRLMILYSRNGESRMITYALPGFTTIVDNALPKLDASP